MVGITNKFDSTIARQGMIHISAGREASGDTAPSDESK